MSNKGSQEFARDWKEACRQLEHHKSIWQQAVKSEVDARNALAVSIIPTDAIADEKFAVWVRFGDIRGEEELVVVTIPRNSDADYLLNIRK